MRRGRSGLTLKLTSLERRLFADILRVGLPTALSTILTNLTVILVTGAFGLFGTTALAACGITSRLDYVMIPLLFGVCAAVLTMVGVNVGAGQLARAKQIAWISAFLRAGSAGTSGATVAMFPMLCLRLFSHDAQVLAIGSTLLRVFAPADAAPLLCCVIAL